MRTAVAFVTALVLAGCTSKPAAADQPKGQLNYKLTVSENVKVKAGAPGAVQIFIKPEGGAHLDPRAPMQLDVKASSVKLGKTTLGHDDVKEQPDKTAQLELPFTGGAPGTDQIQVHADFYLCTAKLCERQVADLSVPVVVE